MTIETLNHLQGLTATEAGERMLKYGRNYIAEKRPNQLIVFLSKFWAPVPWMLELTVILQLVIGKFNEAIIITALLLFNSFLSFFQEERANKTLALLKKQLAINTRVLRDNKWQVLPAEELVPGDIVHLRMGDISPADIRIISGEVLVDQSALTGESLPIESTPGITVYSGALIKRGETTGEVVAIGKNTYFGKTVDLIQTAIPQSHIKNTIFTIVKYLVAADGALAAAVLIYAVWVNLPLVDIIPFVLILLVASIPAALPATFTLATALGARQLAKKGVLITHLSAIEEAAIMDVICLDKTGTITRNQLEVADLHPYAPYTQEDLLKFALCASDEATQDPIDMAIFLAAESTGLAFESPANLKFTPFDPDKKCTEALFPQDNKIIQVIKGAPETIAGMLAKSGTILNDTSRLAQKGYRILAVAIKTTNGEINPEFQPVGLIALYDPPRQDSKALINNLKELGLRVQMVTGDGLATAQAIASQVGIGDYACSKNLLEHENDDSIFKCDVYAGVFPQDKFILVKGLQHLGHATGMTGDGINDAPALKQAEVGVAVSNATDVAKSAASIALTKPGLSGIIAAVETSRAIHKRMLTYILNKIIKSFEIAIFLSLGVIFTKTLIITPLLIVLLLFANDFATMSIASDNVPFSPKPEKWRIKSLVLSGGILSLLMLILSFAVFIFGSRVLHLPLAELQTLTFLILVFTGQGNVYLIRERKHLWHSCPGHWLIWSSILDIIAVSALAIFGILMTAVSPSLVLALVLIVAVYVVIIDFIKVPIFKRFGII